MNRVTHSTRGLDALRAGLAALPRVARTALGDALGETAEGAAQDLRDTLRAAADSRPAQPGSVPDDAAGQIAKAVQAMRSPERPAASVTVDLPYAGDLEFGTRKMAARPFLRPAMFEHGRKAGAALGAALGAAAASLKGFPR